MDAYNYSFALIHGRCLSCKIFWGCNKDVNHKIRFLSFFLDFILFSVFFLFFIDVKSKYKKKTKKINPENCIPNTVYVFRDT